MYFGVASVPHDAYFHSSWSAEAMLHVDLSPVPDIRPELSAVLSADRHRANARPFPLPRLRLPNTSLRGTNYDLPHSTYCDP